MTTRYTNAEWAKLAEDTQAKLGQVEKNAGEEFVSKLSTESLAKTVDHTLLKLDATEAGIDSLCDEARRERFATVCVRLNWVPRALSNLKGSGVGVACVVGFHEGTYDTASKVKEAEDAVKAGATELDVVINYPQLLAKDYSTVYQELATLRTACPAPTTLKLILETSQLQPADIVAATIIASEARFDCVKTSTGFNGRGASVEDVRLMAAVVKLLGKAPRGGEGNGSGNGGQTMFVKASGGVRGLEDAKRMLVAGAGRIGTSSGVWIMQEARAALENGETGRPAATRLYTDNTVDGY